MKNGFAITGPLLIVLAVGSCMADAREDKAALECGHLAVWQLSLEPIVPTNLDSAAVVVTGDITKARLNLLARSLEHYCAAVGRYPSSLDQLFGHEYSVEVESQCRADPDFGNDDWGTPFIYRLEDGVPHLSSAAGDTTLGTEDDIAVARVGDVGAAPIDLGECRLQGS